MVATECKVAIHEEDGKRVPVGEYIIVRSRFGSWVMLVIAGREYEVSGRELSAAINKCIE